MGRMELQKIRLAGFKSFVDPITIPVPGHLVAVVGPNGCGKSNIIDAVCWVMGESSAKYLRGESLTDVIFNGSSARKPVGQASVELVFNNQDGSIGGEFASYAEVSVRRTINREGESSWFLNGGRCRRRDILDIFLGTGLGPRSYSIIGQNMISRVIEAKPEEMRTYLEEAAGISRYRDRRRETETRIRHTRENMARLDDVRNELDRQLDTLKRQADAASKFKLLKQEERMLRATCMALQWRQLDGRRIQITLQLQQQETALEARQTDMLETSFSLERLREDHAAGLEVFQDIQQRFYVAGNDITRIEQDIHHTRERKQQWQADLDQANGECLTAERNLSETSSVLGALSEEIVDLQPLVTAASESAKTADEANTKAENALLAFQDQWDSFSQSSASTNETIQVEQTRISQLTLRQSQLAARSARIESESSLLDSSSEGAEGLRLQEALAAADQQEQQAKSALQQLKSELASIRTEEQGLCKTLDEARQRLQVLQGREASLQALQQTALGEQDAVVSQWISGCGLQDQPRLARGLTVAKGWESAVEKVLGSLMQAVCLETLSGVSGQFSALKKGNFCGFLPELVRLQAVSKDQTARPLLDLVTSEWPLTDLLAGIYAADTLDEAQALAENLAPHESVVTPDGIWLGPSWVRVMREDNPSAGVFQREVELREIADQKVRLDSELKMLEEKLSALRIQLSSGETQRETAQSALGAAMAETARCRHEEKSAADRHGALRDRLQMLAQESGQLASQTAVLAEELEKAGQVLAEALLQQKDQAAARESLLHTRDVLREAEQDAKRGLDSARDEAHMLALRLQAVRSRKTAQEQMHARAGEQLAHATERKKHLEQEGDLLVPLDSLQAELSAALDRRMQIEGELNAARSNTDAISVQMREFEVQRQRLEAESAKLRDVLETLRLESEGLGVRAETLVTQISQMGVRLEELLADMPEEMEPPEEFQSRLEKVMQRIARLGAINLVAIEEYTACTERKQYLDRQFEDLQAGLATLENAIAKIDRETRARFRDTFDRVNECFQALFPRIFGGGRAYMELTSDNLLEAGIRIMACPPGKRNSTIHLLSGGEKAMTAIALVFSIFHLNPAPFCLLDEVDAPLDDANIGRFCELVKSMAEKTQFIFISHNKLAIEMAGHLMGVTMNEPGVSRLVTVNVQEAVGLAGS